MVNIFYMNFNVGSGIEKIGNNILKMLENSNYNITHYQLQNPPYIILKEILKHEPDIIIMNEFYPRSVVTTSLYKLFYPSTKILLINHTLSILNSHPFEWGKHHKYAGHDEIALINDAFRNSIDHIINIDWKPSLPEFPSYIEQKLSHKLFPISPEEFKITNPFDGREKDFMYFGNLYPHKFSIKFIEELEKTDMIVDIYGKLNEEEEKFQEYNQRILNSKNINYHGYCPKEELLDTLNQYRFYIIPRESPEPFMMSMGEGIMAGLIPLVVNDRTNPNADWIEHYNGCYLEYQSVTEIIAKMQYYLKNKNDSKFIQALSIQSGRNAKTMNDRASFSEFDRHLKQILQSQL